MMKTGFLCDREIMPCVVEPETTAEAGIDTLLSWCEANRSMLGKLLCQHGALLFRGFDVPDALAFNTFARAQGAPLQNYVGGDSLRSEIGDKIYTSTEFGSDEELYLHNELSYAGWHPSHVFFYCKIPPTRGGQTTIADGRELFKAMKPTVSEKFAERGVAYVQNLHSGEGQGKSWQQTYETDDRDKVEEHCRQHNVEFRWTAHGLWTRKVTDAVISHPVTGETAWFNQADQFHAFAPSVRIDPALSRETEMELLPCHATYGDGSEISLDDLNEVRRTYIEVEVLYDWQSQDVLMLDNLIAAHGRKPFEGEREILVAMS